MDFVSNARNDFLRGWRPRKAPRDSAGAARHHSEHSVLLTTRHASGSDLPPRPELIYDDAPARR